ncbi:unnamed protein product, partial [Choristocarpus tenellus]
MKFGQHKQGTNSFFCQVCAQEFPADYYGRRPWYCPQVAFLEDVFCIKDPFISGRSIEIVGGVCSVCMHSVCVPCSLFYTVRLCYSCAVEFRSLLPDEIQASIPSTNTNQEKVAKVG